MVKLSSYEEKMLKGEFGEFKQKALEFIVKYAEVLGAEELCEINRATLFIGAQHYLDCFNDEDYDEIFSKFYLNSNKTIPIGKFSPTCISQTCGAACDYFEYERTHLSKEFHEKNNKFLNITREAGVSIVDSCTPYYVGWIPLSGEHYVTTESSNVLMSNSVFGAYGNSDGIEAAVCSAICGRTPLWGNHIKENRYGDCIFQIECSIDTTFDWDILGYTVGRLLPHHGKPILVGNLKKPNVNKLRQCFSSLAVTSAAEICHIVGLTPEAQTIEMALGGKTPKAEIKITQKDYDESYHMICDNGSGEVDYISLGCPHLALDELKEIALYLKDKKIKEGLELLIWTDYATKEMSNVNGYTRLIENSGAYVLTGSCPLVMREESHKHARGMLFNSAKQAHNLKAQTSVKVFYGDMYKCMDAAMSGVWEV